ncbi:MAG TPA: tetratricopeptide repeat protein, partial [Longimicrobium sp.]|nr:tetratricopeptide repeat protein [Longimicrobium sp.]
MSERREAEGEGGCELLATKLAPPRLRAPLVPRPRLMERLDAGLDRRLTLVCAPAGSGKTTLVAAWLADRRAGGGPPYAWVSLEPEDDDPVRFWRYVLAAADGVGADAGAAASRLLQAQQPPWEAVLVAFLNALSALPERRVLVLEDYHALAAERIHEQVAWLVDHLPPTLHLVVVSRAEPPLPLARLRARGDVAEVGPADLRFRRGETRRFLAEAAPALAGEREAAILARTTGGWAAGLRLAALALQGKSGDEARRALASFGGGHRHVRDYLAAEVLAAQPEAVQEFLLRTAFLGRLTPALCDAVTGGSGAAAVLEEVERARLFVVALGEEGGRTWYRFHALFAEAVRECALQRFGEAGVRALYDRASRWHEAEGMPAEAVEAALTARAFERAAALMERVARPELMRNTYATLRRWLDALPAEVLERRPRLCFVHAVSLLFTSDRRDPAALAPVEVPLRRAEAAWAAGDGGGRPWGELSVLRSMVAFWRGDLARMGAAARAGLEELDPEENQWRGIALVFVAFDEVRAGRVAEARRLLVESLARCDAAGNVYGSCSALHMLGDVCALQGETGEAAAYYDRVLARLAETPLNPKQSAYTGGRARLGAAALAWERNDAATAERGAEEAEAVARVSGDDELWAQATLLRARIAFARGEAGDALQGLH